MILAGNVGPDFEWAFKGDVRVSGGGPRRLSREPEEALYWGPEGGDVAGGRKRYSGRNASSESDGGSTGQMA